MRQGYKITDDLIEEFLKRYVEGERVVDIADELNVGKSTLYDLLKKDDIIKRLERDRLLLQNQSRAVLMKDASKYIKNIKEIANNASDVRSKLKANETLLAYIIGKPTEKLEVENVDKDNIDKDVLNDVFKDNEE